MRPEKWPGPIAKVGVEGSNPFARSRFYLLPGWVAPAGTARRWRSQRAACRRLRDGRCPRLSGDRAPRHRAPRQSECGQAAARSGRDRRARQHHPWCGAKRGSAPRSATCIALISTTPSPILETSASGPLIRFVLPVEVPPATRMFFRAATAMRSNSAWPLLVMPAATYSSRVNTATAGRGWRSTVLPPPAAPAPQTSRHFPGVRRKHKTNRYGLRLRHGTRRGARSVRHLRASRGSPYPQARPTAGRSRAGRRG